MFSDMHEEELRLAVENAKKETAREILEWLKDHCDYVGFRLIKFYFKETFGVEVEE
jgi:hypothetical protein